MPPLCFIQGAFVLFDVGAHHVAPAVALHRRLRLRTHSAVRARHAPVQRCHTGGGLVDVVGNDQRQHGFGCQPLEGRDRAQHRHQPRAHGLDGGQAEALVPRQAHRVTRLAHGRADGLVVGVGQQREGVAHPFVLRKLRERMAIQVVVLAPGEDEPPLRVDAPQRGQQSERARQALVHRPAPHVDERGPQGGRRRAGEFVDVHPVLDHAHPIVRHHLAEHRPVVGAAGEDAVITACRAARHAVKKHLLGALRKAGVEEATVRARHHRLAVPPACEREVVEREVDAVHVHHVGFAQVLQHCREQRVALRAAVGQAVHRNAVHHFVGRQHLGLAEHPVERDHARALAMQLLLHARNVEHHVFHAAPRREELTHDVHDPQTHVETSLV